MSALAAPVKRARDDVRMLVTRPDGLVHARFLDLADHLEPGDLLVVNASATLPAALPARREDGRAVDLHLSTPDPANPARWVVELRRHGRRARANPETLELPAGATATLLAPYLGSRLWVAALATPEPLLDYLHRHGAPIRYAHDLQPRPLADYQTIFATEPGSAEMPSAGRPFTKRALQALRARGISVQRIVLHTGVSSLERGERPYPERYRVSEHTAARVKAARRVIAVGTTVVRALETAHDGPSQGWTNLVVTPERGVRAVDGLLTGWHEPESSHLQMLEAFAGRAPLDDAYHVAQQTGYRWHEFGDLQLLLRQ